MARSRSPLDGTSASLHELAYRVNSTMKLFPKLVSLLFQKAPQTKNAQSVWVRGWDRFTMRTVRADEAAREAARARVSRWRNVALACGTVSEQS
jgi:hypothetical protein